MKRHTAALILPYFGTLPNYFPLWLKSAGYNPDFTFMLFTDADCSGYNVPDNVKVIPMTLEGVKKLIAPHLDFEFVLDTPYKLCDYRPMYGLIFQDWLKGYDFWGHVDPDIIWGDLGKFITDDLLDKYGRLYRRGHLTLYRNTPTVNRFVLHKLPYWNISYVDAYTCEHIPFDECVLVEHLFSNFAVDGGGGYAQYDSPDLADVWPMLRQFRCYKYTDLCETVPAFRWKDGKIFGLSLDGEMGNDVEYLYVHLQKRSMKFTPGLENEDSFMIIPNEFVKDHELTQEEITSLITPNQEYERAFTTKYGWKEKRTLIERIKLFMLKSKISRLKILHNRLLGRKLSSLWKSRGVRDTYGYT